MRQLPKTSLFPWLRRNHEIDTSPINWAEFFEHDQPVELDIGCGRGLFTWHASEANPGTNFVGIELAYKEAKRAADKLFKRKLPNARIVAGDVREFLEKYVQPESVAAAHVYFPDPWWKARHAERRLMDEPLLQAIARVLRPGGELFVQTDVEERAAQYLERISACAEFQRTTETGYIDANPYGAQSNRESRAIEDGLPIYRLLFRRV